MSTLSPLTLASHQLSKKPRMLVVDDEPDNLDLLYRTFRRDFKVLKADSGMAALDILAREGEVAVIISDQRMPEMKGTEFLSKTVPDFPDTVRIILTGFTDVEDLVDAINAGQVYRYITKPWDPDELKHVVNRASETYDLIKHQNQEIHRAQIQSKLMVATGQLALQHISLAEALSVLSDSFGQILQADGCGIWTVDGQGSGSYGATDAALLGEMPLVQEALSSQTTQCMLHIQSDSEQAASTFYASGVNSHVVAPISYQGTPVAAISLQWNTDYTQIDDVSQLLSLITPQLALGFKAVSC